MMYLDTDRLGSANCAMVPDDGIWTISYTQTTLVATIAWLGPGLVLDHSLFYNVEPNPHATCGHGNGVGASMII